MSRKTLKFIPGKTNYKDPVQFQIHIIRGHNGYGRRVTPEWVTDERRLQAMLLLAFPKLESDVNQRARAAKWARVIYLFYRAYETTNQIAEMMGITEQTVCSILYRARNAATGLRTDGTPRAAKRGRPPKVRGGTYF